MNNLTKTTKTILFAGLIAAMILPFSGMMMAEAAPNDNANDTAKDRYNYKVEVLSTEVISEEINDDGVKITKFKQTVRQTDFLTIQEFKEMNADLFETLSKKEQAEIVAEFAKNRANTPEVYEIETVKYGDQSIIFEPKTREWPFSWGSIKDPINVVFQGNGNAVTAENVVDSYASHGWKNASGWQQWVFVDETVHGGIAYWSWSGYQLEEVVSSQTRYHLRLFNGGDDSHGQYGKWSIGAVHKETLNGSTHTIDSNGWELAETELKNDLTGATGVSGSIGSFWAANSGYYQGEWNGGAARLVTLS